jgi:hypothetical protein
MAKTTDMRMKDSTIPVTAKYKPIMHDYSSLYTIKGYIKLINKMCLKKAHPMELTY